MDQYMQLALQLAAEWRGRTSPNPMVGAVVVRDGEIVGIGAHEQAGSPHAEVHALNRAGERARGSTLYVTLEPCSHYGKTPPCTERIIAAGVKKVVAAMTDPNPVVQGRGFARLREAGIEVATGMGEKEACRLNEVFLKYITTGLPFVILKTAISLDGKIATSTGDSRWITNQAAREQVHLLRNQVDAILIGKRTLLHDHPRLNVRLSGVEKHQIRDPQKIVLTSQFDLEPETLRQMAVYQLVTERPLLLVTGREWANTGQLRAFEEMGVEVLTVSLTPDGLDLQELLIKLGAKGITSVLLEGGAGVYTGFLRAGLVDKVHVFQAPIILGADGISWVSELGISQIDQAFRLHDVEYQMFDDNSLTTGYFAKEGYGCSLESLRK